MFYYQIYVIDIVLIMVLLSLLFITQLLPIHGAEKIQNIRHKSICVKVKSQIEENIIEEEERTAP